MVGNESQKDSACSPTLQTLSGEVLFVQLYGHPNRTEPLVHQLDFDLCQLTETEAEKVYNFPNNETQSEILQ